MPSVRRETIVWQWFDVQMVDNIPVGFLAPPETVDDARGDGTDGQAERGQPAEDHDAETREQPDQRLHRKPLPTV